MKRRRRTSVFPSTSSARSPGMDSNRRFCRGKSAAICWPESIGRLRHWERAMTVSKREAGAAIGVTARAAAAAIRHRLNGLEPVAAIILGSGLGGLATKIERPVRVPFSEIPGFPSATVAGHAGVLIAGLLGDRPVLALAGRFHMYEGHAAALAAFPTRVLHS